MVTGDNGVSGALVQRAANKENNQEHVNVIHQLQNMEERIVMARHSKVKCVTITYPAQVILNLQPLCKEVFNIYYFFFHICLVKFIWV